MPIKELELKPTPQAYRHMLATIANNSTIKSDREWAKKELEEYTIELWKEDES